eukprot:TRINITY_DN36549_c0_g1_i1.p1 TRINITY_DN36549_c0_g1~~TRINITY_DN36549_c0_g1_i1.p1  ORF type:complete len:792 (-),score=153.68 TRINITY_DN36549_c0_g1_i1:184-2559(-)
MQKGSGLCREAARREEVKKDLRVKVLSRPSSTMSLPSDSAADDKLMRPRLSSQSQSLSDHVPRRRRASTMGEASVQRRQSRRASLSPELYTHFREAMQEIQKELEPDLIAPRPRANTSQIRGDLMNYKATRTQERRGLEDLLEEGVEEPPTESLQVEDLRKAGYTSEELSRVVYDVMKRASPVSSDSDFFSHIRLRENGGLDRIREFLDQHPEKYYWFVLQLACIIFNVGYLISMDWTIFETYTADVIGKDWRDIGGRIQNGGGADAREKIEEAFFEDHSSKANLFSMISDHSTRMQVVNTAALVAFWEVAWIIKKLCSCTYLLWTVSTDTSEYKRYKAITVFFQTLLPQAATFSAIKLAARIHPSLLYPGYFTWINDPPKICGRPIGHQRNKVGYAVLTLTWVITHVLCAMAALSAFAVKLLAVSLKMMNPEYSLLFRVGNIVALLIQVMGCVIMEVALRDRLYLFVFGGSDGIYEEMELAYKSVFETRLTSQILTDYWDKGKYLGAIVLLATLDHYDIQELLIEEGETKYEEKLGLKLPDSSGRGDYVVLADSGLGLGRARSASDGSMLGGVMTDVYSIYSGDARRDAEPISQLPIQQDFKAPRHESSTTAGTASIDMPPLGDQFSPPLVLNEEPLNLPVVRRTPTAGTATPVLGTPRHHSNLQYPLAHDGDSDGSLQVENLIENLIADCSEEPPVLKEHSLHADEANLDLPTKPLLGSPEEADGSRSSRELMREQSDQSIGSSLGMSALGRALGGAGLAWGDGLFPLSRSNTESISEFSENANRSATL